jgi:hypothetical protein
MKKVRMILPVAAILLAVVGVFATGSAKLSLIENVAVISGDCSVDGTCSQTTSALCQLQSNPAVKFMKLPGTPVCSIQSTGTFTETP